MTVRIQMRIVIVLLSVFFVICTQDVSFSQDDYPYSDSCVYPCSDPWGFYNRECTSFVAWKMNRDSGNVESPYSFYNKMLAEEPKHSPNRWSNAYHWDKHAHDLGIRVDNNPVIGAIAQWNENEIGGGYGHVAYVESINDDGTANISEYNYSSPKKYGTRQDVVVPRYIHFNPIVLIPVGTINSGVIKIVGSEGFFGDTEGTVTIGACYAKQQYCSVIQPSITKWTSSEIELNIFTNNFNFDEFGLPIILVLQREDGILVGRITYPFLDVGQTDWFAECTTTLWKRRVIRGRDNGFYWPEASITRAEFLKMAVVASGNECKWLNPFDCLDEPPFEDVKDKKDTWFYPYIKSAYNKGWIVYDDEQHQNFYPENPISRAEAAKILIMALDKEDWNYPPIVYFFEDVPLGEWYHSFVYKCFCLGVFSGYPEDKNCNGEDSPGKRFFCPDKHLNRAETAKVIYQAFVK